MRFRTPMFGFRTRRLGLLNPKRGVPGPDILMPNAEMRDILAHPLRLFESGIASA